MPLRRVLMTATVPSMIGQFNTDNIKILLDMGYMVDVAADFTDTSVWPTERVEKFKDQMKDLGVECIQIDFSRSASKIKRHISAYKQVLKLLSEREYAFIHTHTPISSAIIRMAAKKKGVKVIYTAHGFHFYKGAPFINWFIFYPIEKHLSKYTDVLITINKEDYNRALAKFSAKKTVYVPGVGVDTAKFSEENTENHIREELGINKDVFMLLSVGELNDNKNHAAVIKAISGMDLTYVIAGKGDNEAKLKELARECNSKVILTGFRTDVADFYKAADAYILPSLREGLNVSLMEAMASGLPCLAGKIRGNVDLVDEEGGFTFEPVDVAEIKDAVEKVLKADRAEMSKYNSKKIVSFDKTNVYEKMRKTYEAVMLENE